jgi:FkbM family methyltransferase
MRHFIETAKKLVEDEDVEVIFDLGSREGLDSLAISNQYPLSSIYAFECSPPSIKQCKNNTLGKLNIEVIEKAVTNHTGKVDFNQVIDPYNGDYGASSLFEFGEEPESKVHKTEQIEVDCTRLDDWMEEKSVPKVDLIWMDLQGAELLAMEGLGRHIANVKIIQAEVELRKYYKDQPLIVDVVSWMKEKGFVPTHIPTCTPEALDTDIVFVNNDLL